MIRAAVDPRLRQAIDANVGWYDDLFALHGVGAILDDGAWSALGLLRHSTPTSSSWNRP